METIENIIKVDTEELFRIYIKVDCKQYSTLSFNTKAMLRYYDEMEYCNDCEYKTKQEAKDALLYEVKANNGLTKSVSLEKLKSIWFSDKQSKADLTLEKRLCKNTSYFYEFNHKQYYKINNTFYSFRDVCLEIKKRYVTITILEKVEEELIGISRNDCIESFISAPIYVYDGVIIWDY